MNVPTVVASAGQRRFLRYWAFNMAMTRSWGWSWTPGFSYSESEWRRFDELVGGVTSAAAAIWLIVCPILFILFAALGIVGILLPIATLAWPDPAKTSALGFVSLLALVCFLALGFGFPLSVIWGGRIADGLAGAPLQDFAPGDAELAAKVRSQLWRLIAILCAVLIPGTMAFIIFNLQAGPIVLILKAGVAACIAIGAGAYALSRRTGSP